MLRVSTQAWSSVCVCVCVCVCVGARGLVPFLLGDLSDPDPRDDYWYFYYCSCG
jgi:hypothetical protein